MTEEYKKRAERDMELIDSLPQPVRLLVHEYGAARVVKLWHIGIKPEAIQAQLAA